MSLLDSHNAGPLSITADEDPDLLYLPNASSSFDENLLTAFQSSQQTATSIPDSDFPLPVLAPFSLQRVGPDRRKLFILFNTMNNHTKQEFIKWWQTTMHGSEPDTQHNIRWEAKHISDAWKNFDQVAHHITGEPMVMCRLCGTILPHPHHKKSGTNTMKRHASSEKCRKGAKSPATQQTIQATMKHAAVRSPLISSNYFY